MRILYYNYSFFEQMGGGTHARELLAALNSLPGVEAASWPATGAWLHARDQETAPGSSRLRRLPVDRQEWLRFWFKPLGKELVKLSAEQPEKFDLILFRPNNRLRLVKSLKKQYPLPHLCLEINALMHAEFMRKTWLRPLWLRGEAALINRADSIVVVSEYVRQQLIRLGVAAEKILANPNGANTLRFNDDVRRQREQSRKKLRLPRDAFVLGYVGGMEPFRRLPMMVRQVLNAMEEHRRFHLVIVGDGQERFLVEKIIADAPESTRDRVRLQGAVPYDNVPAVMSSFDLGLFPYSNPYGSPLKLFEYLAMRIPVIGPDVPVVREVFEQDRDLLMADQSGQDFPRLLKDLASNDVLRERLAANGYRRVARDFTWRRNAERLLEFLKQRMDSPGMKGCNAGALAVRHSCCVPPGAADLT